MAKKGPKKGTDEYAKLMKDIRKERNRIQQFVRRASKRGYSFSENAVPSIPKNISEATLERFKAITKEKLYRKSVYVSPEGVTLKGTQRKKQEDSERRKQVEKTRKRYYDNAKRRDKRRAQKQGNNVAPTSETDTVLREIESMIENWQPSTAWSPAFIIIKTHDKNLLKSTLNGVLAREGREAVAQRCQLHAEEVVAIANRVLYGSGNEYKVRGVEGVNTDVQRFATIIGGRSPTVAESMTYTEEAEAMAVSYDE